MIQIKIFVFNPFQENTFILFDESKEAVIIDAGCYSNQEEKILDDFIKENNLQPVHLLNTHCHIDHILGNRYLSESFRINPEAHKSDEFLVETVQSYGATFGIKMEVAPLIGKYLNEGMQINFGNSFLDIAHVPGHSPGSIVFYNKTEGFMIVGDVLFNGSIGRTDLPGGNYRQLISNIKNKLLCMDDKMLVYPGHGPSTTIGKERSSNPFLI
jgi:glyoxylase-like metal-dependent hydrolase (beta-lactamase superfamily II)